MVPTHNQVIDYEGVRNRRAILILSALAVAMGILAALGWIRFLQAVDDGEQVLDITVCTPESYPFGAKDQTGRLFSPMVEQGPSQMACRRPFAVGSRNWDTTEPISVSGQVCNSHDKPVSYILNVNFRSVSNPEIVAQALRIPITFDPGCRVPYNFDYEAPLLIKTTPNDEMGRWHIVGTAIPVTKGIAPYQWDVTDIFVPVNPTN